MKTIVIIPAFNEAASIEGVINSLHDQNPEWHLLVINDCSRDATSELVTQTNRATVINLACNLGVGGGVQTGLIYAQRHHYDIAVKFDGDGQHIASEISKLLEPISADKADVSIGSRFLRKHTGFSSSTTRVLGIKILALFGRLLTKQRITDHTSGFRAYNKRAIEFLAVHYPSFDYPEPEEVVLLGKNSFRVQEIFVEMQNRQGGVSSIQGFKVAYYMIKVLLSMLMIGMRRPIIR